MTSLREISEEFYYQSQYIHLLQILKFLEFDAISVFNINYETKLPQHFEIIFLIFYVFILINILTQNLININFSKILKLLFIIYIILKTIQLFTNLLFYEILSSVMVVGLWEIISSIFIAILFLFLINTIAFNQLSLIANSFLLLFSYSICSLCYANDFIIFYLILELQFFSSFGLLIAALPKNKLNTCFAYLITNILGTVMFLFGLNSLYRTGGTFSFNTYLFTSVEGTSAFIPIGMLVKIIGITSSILFQKIYNKLFFQLYGIFLILAEVAVILFTIKLFTKILILKTSVSVLALMIFTVVSLAASVTAGLRAKNIFNIIIYSSIQNTAILMILAILYNTNNLGPLVSLYLFSYFLTTSFLLKVVQLKSEDLRDSILLIMLFSLAGIPPLLGFYNKILILSTSVVYGYYFFFATISISNLISFCYYGKIIVQTIATSCAGESFKNKFFKINSLFLIIIFSTILCLPVLFINQAIVLFVHNYITLISPTLHPLGYELARSLLPISL